MPKKPGIGSKGTYFSLSLAFRRGFVILPLIISLVMLPGCVSTNGVVGPILGDFVEPAGETALVPEPIPSPPAVPNSNSSAGGYIDADNPADRSGEVGEPADEGDQAADDAGQQPRPRYAIDPVKFRLRSIENAGAGESEELQAVVLTIDDGPRGSLTLDMLEVLQRYEVPAIFFVNGVHFSKNAEEIRRIHSDGHLIGNHAWSHRNLADLSPSEVREEIENTSRMIGELTGSHPVYFRAPFGVYTPLALQVAAELGMQSINWSIDPVDWSYDASDPWQEIVTHIVEHLHPGAVILIHQQEATLLALPAIIEAVREQGYEFVLPTDLIINDEDPEDLVQIARN